MKKILVSVVSGLATLLILLIIISSMMETMASPPDNLRVMMNYESSTYISPECLNPNKDYSDIKYETSPLKVAMDLNFKVDSACTQESIWPSRNSVINWIGVKVGLLKPLDWKWNEDGSWKKEVFDRR